MIDLAIISSIFLTGVALSWGPCMTHYTLILLPYVINTKTKIKAKLKSIAFFSAKRIISYCILGGLAGISGRIISKLFYVSRFKVYVNLMIAVLIFLIGLSILIQGYKENKVCNFIHKNDFFNMFMSGILVGILPCTPLFAILAIIILKVHSFFVGSVLGFIFGVGTFFSPVFIIIFLSIILANKIIISKRLLIGFQRICGVVMMVIGVSIFTMNTIFAGLISKNM